MNVTIKAHDTFKRAAKRFNKHYASFAKDYALLLEELKANPNIGVDLGLGVRKIRMRITSKGKGKSGGARVITCNVIVTTNETEVNLLYIYDKTEREAISQREIEMLLEQSELYNQ